MAASGQRAFRSRFEQIVNSLWVGCGRDTGWVLRPDSPQGPSGLPKPVILHFFQKGSKREHVLPPAGGPAGTLPVNAQTGKLKKMPGESVSSPHSCVPVMLTAVMASQLLVSHWCLIPTTGSWRARHHVRVGCPPGVWSGRLCSVPALHPAGPQRKEFSD